METIEKKFKGFSIPSGFTQTPNEFYDILMYVKDINISELRLLGFMIRATFGWRRDGYSLEFSLTDLEKYLGFGRSTATRTITSLLEREYIERTQIGDRYKYRLVLDEQTQEPWDKTFDWKKKFEEPGASQSHGGTTQSHDKTTQSQSDTGSSPTIEPGQSHDETDNSFTMGLLDEPPTQSGQGVDDALKKVNIEEHKDIINKLLEEEEDIVTQFNLQIFHNELLAKMKLPVSLTDRIKEQIAFSEYTPIAFEKGIVKFRNSLRLNKITSNPIEWLKSTLANEEILYYNELVNDQK